MDYKAVNTVPAIEPWVDAETVASHLGFEADHVRKMARTGKLPGVAMQNGRRVYWRFKLSEVDASFKAQTQLQELANGWKNTIGRVIGIPESQL